MSVTNPASWIRSCLFLFVSIFAPSSKLIHDVRCNAYMICGGRTDLKRGAVFAQSFFAKVESPHHFLASSHLPIAIIPLHAIRGPTASLRPSVSDSRYISTLSRSHAPTRSTTPLRPR
ncbi:hypothetical protein BDV38DRAFT_17614 [Aspergillus pseudotamarii]|uniref:Secreted protein n=1 Tax=Aspergillus pseudotamarii TaxID=132259 RepID=A0A5N6S9R5_ASPPS|nr:uncharacterized protein BDV38DRAFT_17614 [Aspergillus pseudotamarii]KAE8131458.1 hypothetical protein BDV38DRAFT_17614 [Aspergillus pseudotamarii]